MSSDRPNETNAGDPKISVFYWSLPEHPSAKELSLNQTRWHGTDQSGREGLDQSIRKSTNFEAAYRLVDLYDDTMRASQASKLRLKKDIRESVTAFFPSWIEPKPGYTYRHISDGTLVRNGTYRQKEVRPTTVRDIQRINKIFEENKDLNGILIFGTTHDPEDKEKYLSSSIVNSMKNWWSGGDTAQRDESGSGRDSAITDIRMLVSSSPSSNTYTQKRDRLLEFLDHYKIDNELSYTRAQEASSEHAEYGCEVMKVWEDSLNGFQALESVDVTLSEVEQGENKRMEIRRTKNGSSFASQ
ncbi:hypothetical protein I203_107703 [Kwoniella mangroviensis CBS 8507]|uniref:hypothetical protein n=1 Tax=Kwoniella mangroviensis CBS 8507 TaxID=1296122 RepID=UPI00080CE89F|nr:uncharacterized protein I203_02452 [Kwoniella mangroviensis CBS 8507]OCF69056.1 hypothetical protein I203_02452 [Kwoniella mangroviensis CBS 8507]